MRRTFGVLLVLLSTLGLPDAASAQTGEGESSGQQASGFQLQQNYPNPFNPSTTIPFVLNEDLFDEGGVVVSMRIYNMLQQLVDVPVALRHPAGDGVPLLNLEYTRPGEFDAFWDGYDRNGRKAASGLYYVQLTVNGVSQIMKMLVTK
ncbi:MAG TPA: hypothetical protein VLL48_06735 [Longimicrobiales bacterium]|nr:hypothetical protein [Longimicrobiales bacterium]